MLHARERKVLDDESFESLDLFDDDECFNYEDDADFRPNGRFHEAYMESVYNDYNS